MGSKSINLLTYLLKSASVLSFDNKNAASAVTMCATQTTPHAPHLLACMQPMFRMLALNEKCAI